MTALVNISTRRRLLLVLCVVAIILIIAAIAIPNLLRARIAANEGSAVSCMRTINTAQFAYNSSYPTVGYATALADLGPSTAAGCTAAGPSQANACLIDWVNGPFLAGAVNQMLRLWWLRSPTAYEAPRH